MDRKKYMMLIGIVSLTLCFIVFSALEIMNHFMGEEAEINVYSDPVISEFVIDEDDGSLRETVMYFTDSNNYLIPVMKKIPWPENRAIARTTLNNLIDTPANRESTKQLMLNPVIPVGTEIQRLDIKDGVCYVDFSADVLNYETNIDEKNLISSVVYTLTEFDSINQVRISVNDSVNSFKYGADTSVLMDRNYISLNYLGNNIIADNNALVYYNSSAEGIDNYMVPVTVEVMKDESLTIDDIALLINNPPREGLYSTLPEGADIGSVELIDGTAYVDIITTSDNVELSDEAVKSVYLTLEGFLGDDNLSEVILTSDGEPIEVLGGSVSVFANYLY